MKTNWAVRRSADRPTKTAKYDRDNGIAAGIILSAPEQHTRFQVRWAKAFERRRAAENTAAISATE